VDGSERCFQGFVWWRSPLRAENFPKPYGFLGYYYHQRQMQRIGDGKAVELQCPTVRPGLWSPGWRRRNLLRIPYRFLWELNGIHQKKNLLHIIFLWHIVITCPFTIGFYVFCCVIIYGNVWFASFFCWSGVAPFGWCLVFDWMSLAVICVSVAWPWMNVKSFLVLTKHPLEAMV
jgi:hypothetical protein